MSTARVRFPASIDMGFIGLEKLLSLLVSALRHYKGRVRALHAVVHLHVRTLSVWCSLKLPVCVRTNKTHYTDSKDPGHLSENYLRVRNTCTDTQHASKGERCSCGDLWSANAPTPEVPVRDKKLL